MNYLILDLETSIKNRGEDKIGDNKASPFHPKNKIVMAGIKRQGDPKVSIFKSGGDALFPTTTPIFNEILVGHNIKFDIQYLRKTFPTSMEHWLRRGQIWDTQLAEFILSGQTAMYNSLDYCSEKYGGTLKDDKIKEYWKNGIDTEDIPEDELEEYLIHDVLNTEIVFLAQLQEASRRGILPFMRTQMDALLATCEMEWNGMMLDKNVINSGIEELTEDLERVEHHLRTNILSMYVNDASIVDLDSNHHLSVVLFGGERKMKERVALADDDGNPVVYKTGQKKGEQRYKWIDRVLIGAGAYNPRPEWETKTDGIWQSNNDVLDELSGPLVEYIKERRKLTKDLSTYYIGYKNLMWPDGRIHPSLNHCVAKTGRLSSTKPNVQNLTGGD